MHVHDLQHRIRSVVETTVSRLGFDLVAVELVGRGPGAVLRLSIDSPSGVSADDCAGVSRELSPMLDEDDPIATNYTLEVSSPGIERPVQRLADFARFAGFKARVRLVDGYGRRRYTGELTGVHDDEEIGLDVGGEEHRFHLEAIERAHLVLTLDEYQRLAEGLPESENADDHQ